MPMLMGLLSDIDGLYEDDPVKNKNAKLIPVVNSIDESIFNMAKGAGSSRGTGGMVKIGRASVGKECSEPCRSRWSPYH